MRRDRRAHDDFRPAHPRLPLVTRRLATVSALSGAFASGLLITAPAHAHAFAQRYDLPVPLALYLIGAGAAVALSFLVMALFMRAADARPSYPRLNLLALRSARWLASPTLTGTLRALGVALLLLIVLSGLLGEQSPARNFAPTFVWIIWWVGLAYVCALVGNLWALLNPWDSSFAWAEALYRRLRPGRELARRLPYPQGLGVWPASLLFLAFAWAELVYYGSAVPAQLAWMIIVYSLITWGGMWLFGRERWLASAEAFSLAFGVLARFAPTEIRIRNTRECARCALHCRDRDGECVNCYKCFRRARPQERELALRPFAVGLLRAEPVSLSMVGFVLLMLSTILFDGYMATPPWAELTTALYPLLPDPGGQGLLLIRTAGLVSFWLLFASVYAAVCGLMAWASNWRISPVQAAVSFAYTLVPIAIAYHLAHYLSYLLIQGQLTIALASDPFGYGWDLFGTAAYRIDISVVGARFAWYTAVVAIVLGHVTAVYLAHTKAVRVVPRPRAAQRSQYPMSALMVLYTVGGLWVLAQPIVEAPATPAAETPSAAAAIRVPPDAVLPEAGSGELRAVGSGREAALKLSYRAMLSAFHDGNPMTSADLLYPYVFAYRWGVKREGESVYDPQVDAATALLRERLLGIRLTGIDRSRSVRIAELQLPRELAIVEVYLSTAAGADPLAAAAIAPPWSSIPWQLIVLMEEGVHRGWAAFSREEAARRGVPWLDLVRDAELAQRLLALAEEFARSGYRPEALQALVSTQEARARWQALATFHRQHGHLLVTNGPYRLKEWSAAAVVLDVFRDFGYPLGVGSFDAYAIPLRAHVARIDHKQDGLRIHAEVERVQKIPRGYEIVRQPLPASASSARQDALPVCRYVLVDAEGEVVLAGRAPLAADGSFVLTLGGQLEPGAYTLSLALYLGGNTMNPDVRHIGFELRDGAIHYAANDPAAAKQ